VTRKFFDLVLPDVGHRCIVSRSTGRWEHVFYPDNGLTAEKASSVAGGDGEVYFACASYVDPSAGRKGANVQAVRSFWIDVDTGELKGEDNAPYANKREANRDLARFCSELALPRPTVVTSGYGLHAYWPMDADLTPDEWRETAAALKRACDLWGVKADHSRTSDIASILRVPGTFNRKDQSNPAPVSVVRLDGQASHSEFHSKLVAYVERDLALTPFGSRGVVSNIGILSADRWFDRLPPEDQNACLSEMLQVPVVAALADTSDSAPQPNWRTILAACARSGAPDAYSLCRSWAQTSSRFDTADFDGRWRSYANG
jgi:hypothetical protein